MRNALKISVAIGCLAAVPSVALAATGSTSGKPLAINCATTQLKPKKIVVACGDAGIWLSKLKWSSWGATRASGSGVFNWNDCSPTCSAGKIKTGPVKVTLSNPKTCPGQAQPDFKRASLTYTGTAPKYHPATVKFSCPVLPGQY
jgi:hypothetical protein